ncbi:MAG: hypothetical protein KDA20_03230 [Phycisphaerales bacterium]|nr:hypothetical protein [Phycisphaerales bacterium]
MSDAPHTSDSKTDNTAPSALGTDAENVGLVRELIELILHNKKWWLVPVIIVLLAIGLLVAVGSTALAPYLYPLF